MTVPLRRLFLALLGALLFWAGSALTLLFLAAAIWLLTEGREPSWILLAVTVPTAIVGWWIIRRSGVRMSEALNI